MRVFYLPQRRCHATAARLLTDVISKYEDLNTLPYPEQTAKIRALIKETEEDNALKNAANTIPGVANWLTILKTNNEECNSLYLTRTAEAQTDLRVL